MILGTVIIGAATSIASGGIAVIVISAIFGFGVGGVFGSYVKKKYKDSESSMTELEKASFRALLMIKTYNDIMSKYEKDIGILLLCKILNEGDRKSVV